MYNEILGSNQYIRFHSPLPLGKMEQCACIALTRLTLELSARFNPLKGRQLNANFDREKLCCVAVAFFRTDQRSTSSFFIWLLK